MAGRERAGTNIETKPSSAAPVQQNHPCNPEFVTLMPRLMEKEIVRIAQQRRSECQRDGLLDGGGRGRPRSDRRAFVVQGWGLLLDGGPRTAALRQKSVRGAG